MMATLRFTKRVLTGLLLCGPGFAGSDDSQKLTQCIDQKDRPCVVTLLKAGSAYPSADYFAVAARARMFLGQNQEALESIAKAIQMKPGNFDLLMQQGWLFQRSGDQVSAVRSFLLASQIDARSATVFYELGMSFFLAQEYERSIHHFEHALTLNAADDKAEFMLGVVEIWQGHLEDARIHFVKALSLRPHNAHYLLHYGVLLAKLMQPDQAMSAMREARRLDPSNPLTHYQLGKCDREAGKFEEARQELELAVKLRPTLSPAFYQLGTVYRHMGEELKAREAFRRFGVLSENEKTDKRDPVDANLEN